MINLDFGFVHWRHINLLNLYMYTSKALTVKQHNSGIAISYKSDYVVDHLIDFLTQNHIDYSHSKETIEIKCKKCNTLVDYQKEYKHILPYDKVLPIILTLSTQLQYIHQKKYVIDNLYRKDILILDNNYALYVGAHHIESVQNSKITIPDNIYTFGVLMIKLLFNKDVTKDKYNPEKVIEPLYYSNLYWTILRCIDKNPDNRVLLYI
jgi:hypothetical protein